MRSFGVLGLFASLWLCGCSAPPKSEEIALADEAKQVSWADYLHTPERRFVAAPLSEPTEPEPEAPAIEPPPRVVGPAHPKVSASYEDLGDGLRLLDDLSAVDMPAIDVDTGIVVVPQLQILQLTTLIGWFKVSWLDPSGHGESLDLVGDDGELSPREMRPRLREVNAKLSASRWRSMERLAVELPNDDTLRLDRDDPPAERRVEAIVQHGELIVRIPGVRVLERHRLERSRVMSLHRLYADRDSGTALAIFMDCTGDNCTCDPAFTAQVMRFDAATFAAIDRRPCSHCEPTDFGFNKGDPWG